MYLGSRFVYKYHTTLHFIFCFGNYGNSVSPPHLNKVKDNFIMWHPYIQISISSKLLFYFSRKLLFQCTYCIQVRFNFNPKIDKLKPLTLFLKLKSTTDLFQDLILQIYFYVIYICICLCSCNHLYFIPVT